MRTLGEPGATLFAVAALHAEDASTIDLPCKAISRTVRWRSFSVRCLTALDRSENVLQFFPSNIAKCCVCYPKCAITRGPPADLPTQFAPLCDLGAASLQRYALVVTRLTSLDSHHLVPSQKLKVTVSWPSSSSSTGHSKRKDARLTHHIDEILLPWSVSRAFVDRVDAVSNLVIQRGLSIRELGRRMHNR
jgi:hypothetical protein